MECIFQQLIEPEYRIHDPINPRSALLKFIQRWDLPLNSHVTIDAGFSDMSILDVLTDKRVFLHSLDRQAAQKSIL